MSKRQREGQGDELEALRDEIKALRGELSAIKTDSKYFYSSANCSQLCAEGINSSMPMQGAPADHVAMQLKQLHALDFNETLNTSSYVNVMFEKDEADIAMMGAAINIADQTAMLGAHFCVS